MKLIIQKKNTNNTSTTITSALLFVCREPNKIRRGKRKGPLVEREGLLLVVAFVPFVVCFAAEELVGRGSA